MGKLFIVSIVDAPKFQCVVGSFNRDSWMPICSDVHDEASVDPVEYFHHSCGVVYGCKRYVEVLRVPLSIVVVAGDRRGNILPYPKINNICASHGIGHSKNYLSPRCRKVSRRHCQLYCVRAQRDVPEYVATICIGETLVDAVERNGHPLNTHLSRVL